MGKFTLLLPPYTIQLAPRLSYRCYITVMFTVLYITAMSQPLKRLNSVSYNVNEGLLQSHVSDLAEDGNGFIWISTGSGVQRFDGRQFHQVPLNNTSKGLPDDKYVHFFRLANGNLWIAHNKGISEYNIHTNSFNTVRSFTDTLTKAAWCLLEERDMVWCLENTRLIQINKTTHDATIITGITAGPLLSELIPAKNFVAATDSLLLLLSADRQIQIINLRTARTSIIKASITQQQFFAIEKLDNQTILVATARGVEKLDLQTLGFSFLAKYPIVPGLHKQAYPVHLQAGKDGAFIVTIGDQMYELDTKTGNYISQLVNLQNQSFLNNGYFIACIGDSFNNLWALSVNDGIRKINYHFPGFRYFGTSNRANNFVKSIYVDKEANLVFSGTYNYGLFVFDTSQQLIKHINDFPGARPSFTISGISKMADHEYILYLMGGSDAYVLNTQNFTIRKLTVSLESKDIIPNPARRRLFDYYLTALPSTGGQHSLQSHSALYNVSYAPPSRLKLELLDTINATSISAYTDRQQRTWIGAPGAYYLRPGNKSPMLSFSLPGKTLSRCFYHDKAGNMWMGTEKGLFLLDEKGNVRKIFGKPDGLPDDCIYSIREDRKANLWFTHNKGLTCMTRSGIFSHFNKSDGLQENEFNTNTYFETNDGELYFGGVNGISSFYPDAISNINALPKTLINGIKINDEYWKNDTAYWSITQLDLPYDSNIVSFEFSAVGLRNADQYNYQYQLDAVDRTWINAGNNPIARYILTPGTYTFRYYAGNSFNKSTGDFKQIHITIHQPLWKRGWFIAATIIAVLTLLAFLISFYSKRKLHRQLRELETQRSVQHERERISRELHDNIGSQLSFISSTIDWVIDAPPTMSRQDQMQRLQDVNTTAKHVISDLRETIWALKKENIQADELADRLKLFVRAQQAQLDINITEHTEPGMLFSPTDALNIFRICQEAIMNCIRHACAQQLCIAIQSGKDDSFLITIVDNGKGFLLQHEYPGHYGLENMQHRATELGATLVIDTAPGKGTSIIVKR
jgi:signal transduction histidine kinase